MTAGEINLRQFSQTELMHMVFQNIQELQAVLSNPDSSFRSAPFWGWNDKLDKDELIRQMADMHEKGMGGVFIHSREGLETPYLSEEWMEDVKACAKKARDLNMELWIYDEDKWPSGAAGGLVSSLDPEAYTAKAITLEVTEDPFCKEEEGTLLIGIYRGEIKGNRLTLCPCGGKTIILRREISAKSEWYNGYAPTDMLNPEAVREYLRITHEAYRKALGDDFGGAKGFFTDEPNCCDFYSSFTEGRPWLPWSDGFVSFFKERRGYDPVPLLPFLFFTGQGSEKIRHDYWRSITELFGESYMKQVSEYCEKYGLELTGHMLYENDLGYNIRVCGGAMPQYRYLHRPGIDLLGEQCREYLTVKQCSSVARQYGREHTITETYGCTGWEFDFEGQKWLGDWMFAGGITRRCQHLAQYSVTGCRKRDYPPVFNYQNSWWEENGKTEDYFARLTACLQTGEAVRDILVIHPLSGLWTQCGSNPSEDLGRVEMNMGWTDAHIMELNEKGNELNRLAEALCRSHLDFDFGDEIILSEIGSVEGNKLQVGKCSYSVVVVPETLSLFASTVTLLEQFTKAGGQVLWMGCPAMVEGEKRDLKALVNSGKSVKGTARLLRELESMKVLSGLSLYGTEDTEILTMLRKTEDGYVLFACNHDRDKAHHVTWYLPENGRVTSYDAWENRYRELSWEAQEEGISFAEELTPGDSRIYFLETEKEPARAPERLKPPYEHPHRTEKLFAVLGAGAKVRRSDMNALVLDTCRFSLENEPFGEETEIWRAQKAIRQKLSMQQVYYNGAPQRYTWLSQKESGRASFSLEMRFTVKEVPRGLCYLAAEKPEGLYLTCNGTPCELTRKWYFDRAMLCYKLPPLQEGENILLLSGIYTERRELEDMFLLGNFAVDGNRCLVRETGHLAMGDWCKQGYPHYNGSMVYTYKLPEIPEESRIILNMGDYGGVYSRVFVNGSEAALLFGKCRREADITPYLSRFGDNTLEVEIMGSPRNLCGPFHQTYHGCSRISWEDFRTEGMYFTKDYITVPYGLFEEITLTLV